MRFKSKPLLLFAVAISLPLACAEFKQAGSDIGHGTKDLTRAVGHGARDVTRAIGHGTRDAVKAVGDEVKKATDSSKPKK